MALEIPVAEGGVTDVVATALLSRARTRLLQRVASVEPGLAQIWFRASVLERYRGTPGFQLVEPTLLGGCVGRIGASILASLAKRPARNPMCSCISVRGTWVNGSLRVNARIGSVTPSHCPLV